MLAIRVIDSLVRRRSASTPGTGLGSDMFLMSSPSILVSVVSIVGHPVVLADHQTDMPCVVAAARKIVTSCGRPRSRQRLQQLVLVEIVEPGLGSSRRFRRRGRSPGCGPRKKLRKMLIEAQARTARET